MILTSSCVKMDSIVAQRLDSEVFVLRSYDSSGDSPVAALPHETLLCRRGAGSAWLSYYII